MFFEPIPPHLRDTGVGDEGAIALGEALGRNGVLEDLRLGGARIGFELLRNGESYLPLTDKMIGDKGACAFASALEKNDTLISLQLAGAV